MTYKIATHNSATGEKGKGILSWLATPFSRCQSKTLKEQYEAGCRFFDIRAVRDRKSGRFYAAHGLWRSKRDLLDLVQEIVYQHDSAYYTLTIEHGDEQTAEQMMDYLGKIRNANSKMRRQCVYIAVKHPRWHIYKEFQRVPCKVGFVNLDWSSWHTLLPLPWLWKKIYHNRPTFTESEYTLVDFL